MLVCKEQAKTITDLEAHIERLGSKLGEKDAESDKLKSNINSLKNQVNVASKDAVCEV